MAKLATLLLVVLAVSVGINAAAGECNKANNGFLLWLDATNAATITATVDTPLTVAQTGHCKEVWNAVSKYCCSADALKTQFDVVIAANVASWGLLVPTVVRVRNVLSKIKAYVDAADATKAILVARFGRAASLPEFDGVNAADSYTLLQSAQTTFEAQLTAFKANAPSCFTKNIVRRGKTFCMGCQGDLAPNSLFTTTGKYKLKFTDVTAIITDCYDTYKFLFMTKAMVGMASQVKQGLTGTAAGQTLLTTNYAGVTTDALRAAYTNCPTSAAIVSTPAACTQTNLNNIVIAAFNWLKAPMQASALPESSTFASRRLVAGVDSGLFIVDDTAATTLAATLASVPSTLSIDVSKAGDISKSASALKCLFAMILAAVALLN